MGGPPRASGTASCRKAVASPVAAASIGCSGCTVMVLYGEHHVAHARSGDESLASLWKEPKNESSPCCEDLSYHEGRLYLLTREVPCGRSNSPAPEGVRRWRSLHPRTRLSSVNSPLLGRVASSSWSAGASQAGGAAPCRTERFELFKL